MPNSVADGMRSIWHHRQLIISLAKREIIGRYQSSFLGVLWSVINPLILLLVYTFVFSVVFKARWGAGDSSRVEFAIVLFVGLLIFNLVSEIIIKSPTIIVYNTNFVKKIIFPLEVFPVVILLSSLFHMLMSFFVWLLVYAVFFGVPHLEILYFPIVLAPVCILSLGLSWFLSALGVYLRDLAQVVGPLTTVVMFLSPIFYPVSALPPEFQALLHLNPLTLVIEQARTVLVFGGDLDWKAISALMLGSIIFASCGLAWFQKTRKGFADVL